MPKQLVGCFIVLLFAVPYKSMGQVSCHANMPARFASLTDKKPNIQAHNFLPSHKNMVLINAGQYYMGAADKKGRPDEYPRHKVKLSSFWIDKYAVTNAQFAAFVTATGYITTAEKAPTGKR